MDLLASNKQREPLWMKSYRASEVYDLQNVTRASMERLLLSFHNATGPGATAYELERRFFMSSTPEEYQLSVMSGAKWSACATRSLARTVRRTKGSKAAHTGGQTDLRTWAENELNCLSCVQWWLHNQLHVL